jgi:YD repeat-containing protein
VSPLGRSPGQLPTLFSYDADGRLLHAVRTAGTTERRVDYTYDARGYTSSVSAPASSVQTLQTSYPDNDARGPPWQVDIFGAGSIAIRRDIEGLPEGITPPGQPEHDFAYSGIGQSTEYRPPGVMSAPTPGDCPLGATCVVYDGARRVADVVRADGATVTPSYHATTGLTTRVVDSADGTWGFAYTTHGRLASMTGPDGAAMGFGWQSDLPIFTTWSGTHVVEREGATVWSGTLSGRVDATYDNALRLARLAVTSGEAVDYGYDLDGLVTTVTPATTAFVAFQKRT